jgi:hypothetical protein
MFDAKYINIVAINDEINDASKYPKNIDAVLNIYGAVRYIIGK